MKITVKEFQLLKSAPNSAYKAIMPEFLNHSNKLEGSTFSEDELVRLALDGKVQGDHSIDDVMETRNSIDVFGYVIDTLGQPTSEGFLIALNEMLFRGTSREAAGWTGHYKELANRIGGSSVQVALPSDIPTAIPELLAAYPDGSSSFEDIADFHVRFEHLHPFQDGNGRIGRFLMFKQCIESGVDLIVIDDENNDPYKAWLELAQTTGDKRFFYDLLHQCQTRFDAKMDALGVTRLIDDLHKSGQKPKRQRLGELQGEMTKASEQLNADAQRSHDHRSDHDTPDEDDR